MSDTIKKQDIEKVIREIHNRWDRNEDISKKEKALLYVRRKRIQEIIREKEGQNLPLDELVIACWKEFSERDEEEGTLGLDPSLLDPELIKAIALLIKAIGSATYDVAKALSLLILTYEFGKRKSMSLDKLIEIINL